MNYEKESIEATVERLYHICEQMNGMIGTNIYMLEAICDKFNLDFEKEFTLASLAMEAKRDAIESAMDDEEGDDDE